MRLIFILFLIAVANFACAQDQHMIPKEKWSKKFYISDEFCATKGLKPGETNGLLRAWNADTKAKTKGLFRVVDIRWYFNSATQAEQYLKLNMPLLSESGDPVNTSIKIKNVSNLYIFNEGAGQRSMNQALGIKNFMYYFLFTVKNYVAKVFVSSEKQIPVSEAAVFAQEAAKRLNAALTPSPEGVNH